MAPQSRGKKDRRRHVTTYSSTPELLTLSKNKPLTIPSPDRTPTATYPPIPPGSEDSQPASAEDPDEDDEADFQSHYTFDDEGSNSASPSVSDDDDGGPSSRRLSLPHAQSSFSGPNAFAPPFYGRPPTPLPPSPSLTSLLRPPFSTTTSRPTTPDSSDQDTPNDTEAAVAKSAQTATTVPRASPKVPTYEYYGFILYLASSLAFLIYLLWSYLPSPFLHQLGIYYYPNRWWSLAIPAFLVMLIVYIYVALASYNTSYLTLPMNSIENIVDEAAHVAAIDSKGKVKKMLKGKMKGGVGVEGMEKVEWRRLWNEGTDAVMDIPVGGICEMLYGEGRVEQEHQQGITDSLSGVDRSD